MNSKKFSFSFFIIFISIQIALLFISILLYIYDPFQFFHTPIFREKTFMGDMRVSAAGIIDHYDFDSIIAGSSMLENTSIKEAEQIIGGKWVNFSFGGSRFEERFILLNYILKNKKPIKKIIYGLDAYHLITPHTNGMALKPELYDDSKIIRFFTRFTYFMNMHFIICALKWENNNDCVGMNDLDKVTPWYPKNKQYFNGFNNWKEESKEEALRALYIFKNTPPPPEMTKKELFH